MAKKAQFQLPDELNTSMVTSKFRASYAHILEPWSGDPDKDRRYSVQMIFDKNDPWIKKAKERVVAIAKEAFGPNAVKLMKAGKLKSPFRDGDLENEDDEVYQGKIFINANGNFEGKKPPDLIDQRKRNIRDMPNPEEIFYSGCYARAEIKFYPFDNSGNKGVACFLFKVQYWEKGEPLGGGRSADEVFDEIETDEDVFGDNDIEEEDNDDDIPF